MSDNYTISYPILAYKSNVPTDNEIYIANLVHNEPQKLVNISPFRFLQFVETGLNPEKHFNSDLTQNTSIFILVELDSKIYLLCYRCFPWPIYKDRILSTDLDRFQLNDQLQLIRGVIDP